jgi:hypothetical protein
MGLTMSHLMKSLPAPGWLRELVDATAVYQELLGWPVSVQVGERNLVVAVGRVVDAVTMPATLGASLRQHCAAAPIMTNPAGTSWTFLVKPAPFPLDGGPALRVHRAGSRLVIPAAMSVTTGPGVRWIRCPLPNHAPPSLAALVDAAHDYHRGLDRSA